MSDISSDKIKSLLSDPKNIELIATLAGTVGTGGLLGALSGVEKQDMISGLPVPKKENSEEDAVSLPVVAESGERNSFSPDLLRNTAVSDKRIALLRAIKPYISDSKKERVDGLVRAISVAGILNNYKGGLFG